MCSGCIFCTRSQTQRLLYLSVLVAAFIILPKPKRPFYLNERIFRNGRLHSDGDVVNVEPTARARVSDSAAARRRYFILIYMCRFIYLTLKERNIPASSKKTQAGLIFFPTDASHPLKPVRLCVISARCYVVLERRLARER